MVMIHCRQLAGNNRMRISRITKDFDTERQKRRDESLKRRTAIIKRYKKKKKKREANGGFLFWATPTPSIERYGNCKWKLLPLRTSPSSSGHHRGYPVASSTSRRAVARRIGAPSECFHHQMRKSKWPCKIASVGTHWTEPATPNRLWSDEAVVDSVPRPAAPERRIEPLCADQTRPIQVVVRPP